MYTDHSVFAVQTTPFSDKCIRLNNKDTKIIIKYTKNKDAGQGRYRSKPKYRNVTTTVVENRYRLKYFL